MQQPNLLTETTPCKLCGATETEWMWAAHDLDFNIPGEFPLVRCRRCGLIYLQSRPTPQEIGRYYPPEYSPYRGAIQDERFFLVRWARRRTILRRCRVVEQVSPRVPGRILDVGCSTGIFLDAMREGGWETQGIDLSPQAVEYARQRLGLQVFQGQLLEAQLPPNFFDVVTLWDVLEHTFDPLETLREVNRLLVEGGIVELTLPHWESFDRRLFGREWIGYDCPRHLFIFSRPVLRNLLEKSGFYLVQARCDFGGYATFIASLRLWLNQRILLPRVRQFIVKLLDLPGVRHPFAPFFKLVDWLGWGGSLLVIARKV